MKIDILFNVPVRLGLAARLSSESDQIQMDGKYRLVEIPILVGNFNPRLKQFINLFLLTKASSGNKDLSSTAKAFKTWVQWLVDEQVNPFSLPESKPKSPTYGFRQFLLERVIDKQNLKRSTANSYVLVIKTFYEMLIEEGIVDNRVFFRSKLSIHDGYRKLQSSDLAIQVSRPVDNALKPLDHETQKKALQLIEEQSEEFKLIFKLMIFSGLRLGEALSFPCSLLNDEQFPTNDSKLIRGVIIGPKLGINTKFSKERELFITLKLAEEIIDYEFSNRYSKKKLKYLSNIHPLPSNIPLFLSINNNRISKSAFYSAWSRFKRQYKNTYNEDLTHKPHDLRATFATNMLEVAMQLSPNNLESCIETTRFYMGHRHVETTLKYVKFLHRRSSAKQVAQVMDKYIRDVFMELV